MNGVDINDIRLYESLWTCHGNVRMYDDNKDKYPNHKKEYRSIMNKLLKSDNINLFDDLIINFTKERNINLEIFGYYNRDQSFM